MHVFPFVIIHAQLLQVDPHDYHMKYLCNNDTYIAPDFFFNHTSAIVLVKRFTVKTSYYNPNIKLWTGADIT